MAYQTTIVTYGGGDILEKVFNGIAMLTANGGIIPLLCGFTIFLGISIGVFKAYLGDFEGVSFKKYLLPLCTLSLLCFAPKSTVHIEDIFRNKVSNVDNVPILLSKTAELISTCGYGLTRAFESVMHRAGENYYRLTPDGSGKNNYASAGMIFGAESIMDLNRYKIANGDLEQNMKRFAKQCVMYDLAHGKYTFDELKSTEDLWEFLKNSSSDLRMIRYTPEDTTRESFLSCKDALKSMESAFGNEKARLSRNELLKHLPFAFKILSGVQKETESLINQQMMISYLSDNFAGTEYANMRAHSQQKNTYLIVGALASSSLLTMRAILEALIYVAFLFVMPMSLLPKGVQVLKSWFQLLVWIQLWTPFYAVINYIQQVSAHSYADSIFPSLASRSLTIATSIGLENLHQDMYALGGYLAMSIPFISYAVVWGGAQSFIHMAGSMLTPAHSASTTSSGELVSGNYSLANANFGQMHYKNASMLQQQSAPSLSSGFMSENRGRHTLTHSEEGSIYHGNISSSQYNLDWSKSLSSTASNQLQNAQTAIDTTQRSFSESISNHARNMADVTEHFGNSTSFGSGYSSREATALQESANFVQNKVESFAKQHGMGTREALDCLFSASPQLFGIGGGVSHNNGKYDDQTLSEANNIAQSEDFQRHFQMVQDISKSENFNSLNDHGKRLVSAYTKSLDQVASHSEQLNAALSNMESVTTTQAWIDQNSASLRENLGQEFWGFVEKKVGTAEATKLFDAGSPNLKGFADSFMNCKYEEIKRMVPITSSPSNHFEEAMIPTVPSTHPNISDIPDHGTFADYETINRSGSGLKLEFDKKMTRKKSLLENQEASLESDKLNLNMEVREDKEKYVIQRGIEGVANASVRAADRAASWARNTGSDPNAGMIAKSGAAVIDSGAKLWDYINEAYSGSKKDEAPIAQKYGENPIFPAEMSIRSPKKPLWRQK